MIPERARSLFNGFLTFISRVIQVGCRSQWLHEYLTIIIRSLHSSNRLHYVTPACPI